MKEDGGLKPSLKEDGALKGSLEVGRSSKLLLKEAGFLAKGAGFFWPESRLLCPESRLLWPESRLTPANAGSIYRKTRKSRLSPASAGSSFGRKKEPAFPAKAGFFPKRAGFSGQSRLLLARKPAPLAKRAGFFGQKEPAYAGFTSRLFPLGATGKSRPKPAQPASFWPGKEPAYTGQSRLLLLAGFGRLWPALARTSGWRPKDEYVTAGIGLWPISSFLHDVIFGDFGAGFCRLQPALRKTLLQRPKETASRRKPAFLGFSWEQGSRLLPASARSDEWGRLNHSDGPSGRHLLLFLTGKEGS